MSEVRQVHPTQGLSGKDRATYSSFCVNLDLDGITHSPFQVAFCLHRIREAVVAAQVASQDGLYNGRTLERHSLTKLRYGGSTF